MGAEKIIIGARNIEKAQKILEKEWSKVDKNAKDKIKIIYLDNSDFDTCKTFTEDVKAYLGEKPIDIISCNAGLFSAEMKSNPQNWEYVFALNYLSHVIIVERLKDALKKSKDPRVVSTASYGSFLYLKKMPTWEQLKGDGTKIFKSGYDTYTFSKLAQVLYTRALAKNEPTITASSLHPGTVITDIWRSGSSLIDLIQYNLMKVLPMKTSWEGCNTILHCAVADDIKNGAYYEDTYVYPFAPKARSMKR
eukprot:CAMPEP_0117422052 /NCGR_PEP_ID=MMETSP0758-20121206/2974_1 /TAXON_ID=63605 /ORGANISM="Percolomonas cosmopolitus, Strain AE-1 (ATCC 50343)" /LENGTH=249 /DNA_ID=CAMNT_0005204451 /DNA_START=176 /DNA_END=922 /DNA_ORIENTATION=-